MTIGASLPHDSAPRHVTGQARYVDDVPLPQGALHLAFGLSTEAHADIAALDLTQVRAAPGVVAVFSAQNLPDMPDVSPTVHDEPLLAVGKVHYAGQPVFLVVAQSHLQARKAARLAKITYAPLPALLTVEQALAANSRFEQGPIVWSRGDVADMAKAAVYVMNRLPHPQSKDRARRTHSAYELATGRKPDLSVMIAGPGELVVADFVGKKANSGENTGEFCYFICPHEAGWLVRSFESNKSFVTYHIRRLSSPGK